MDLSTMHEMPDLFKIGDWWYHIVTEYSDRSKMEMCIRDRFSDIGTTILKKHPIGEHPSMIAASSISSGKNLLNE